MFLSHTSELRLHPANKSFVAAAEEAVNRVGDAVTDMAYFSARDGAPAELCREKVLEADIFVLIAGFRYGSPVSDVPDRSYVEHEYAVATAAGIPRLVFLLDDNAEGPSALFRDLEFGARQELFRERLRSSGPVCATVRSPDELVTEVMHSLADLRRREAFRSAEPSVAIRRSAYLRQVERIAPPELVNRDAELAELAEFCIAPDGEPGISQYVWWRAPAWSGKSALMSTFVLQPPGSVRDRVSIVSFFITPRRPRILGQPSWTL